MYVASTGKSFKDSLKVLEADIQHANTLASELPREYDGACLQMRMSYAPAAHFLLFLVQWTDCHLAGALGLLRILIYKVYVDGTTTMSTHERKASIREFYGVIYPSLLQLENGVTDTEDKKQKSVCMERYRKRDEHRHFSDVDSEREEECGICMESYSKIVLPNCNHALCLKCYREWTPFVVEQVNTGSGPPGSKVGWFRSVSNKPRFINTVSFDSAKMMPPPWLWFMDTLWWIKQA